MESEKFLINQESKEKIKEYSLSVTLTRHGVKEGMDSGLSEEGKIETRDYYMDVYRGVPIDEGVEREVVSSSKDRAIETADIYQKTLTMMHGTKQVLPKIDDRLGESNAANFAEQQPEKERENWFKNWLESAEGKNAVRGFVEWLLENIHNQQKNGGKKDIDAFSHAPLMAGFIIELEKRLGINILTTKGSGDTYSRKNLAGYDSKMGYLTNINILTSSENPDSINLIYAGKTYKIPIEILRGIMI